MDLTAFTLDDIGYPLTTETPEFTLDGFQWDAPADLTVATVSIVARDPGRTLTAGAAGRSIPAADCGRVLMASRETWAGRWSLKVGEKRHLAIDFAAMNELAEGESLTGTPTVAMTDLGSGLVLTAPGVTGTEAAFWCDAAAGVVDPDDLLAAEGAGYTDYGLEVTVGTTGGATLSRSATVRIEE